MFVKPLNVTLSTLEQLYSDLQKSPGAMYLDSAADNHENSNHSVFVWEPKYIIEADLKTTRIYQQNKLIEQSDDDPLKVIQNYLNTLPKFDSELPFYGGAIGYWDYELGGRFEALPIPRRNDIRLPNMYVGIYESAIVFDHQNAEALFVSVSENAETVFHFITQRINKEPKETKPCFRLTSAWQSNMSKTEYEEKFNQVHEYLLSGDCYQINLAQRFSAQYEGDEWSAYTKLKEQNSAPFSSFIRLKQGVVLSVSPERFIQVKGTLAETKPIKGTRPRSDNPQKDKALAEELRNATKDRAENLMIVDLLRNDLSKVAVPGTVEVPSLFAIESFPAVHHLVSTVTAQIRAQFNALDLLRGAFPGGSITGAPKIRAMQIIHELEPHPRSVYCGAIGYITPNGDMDTNITIRTLVCNKNQIHCWAGGGLVADSECDAEYQETLDKVNKILPVLSEI